jgi:tetratricopeptide (TPR) repeat protein
MEDRQVAVLIAQADRCRRAHDWNGAMTLLRRALAHEPEHAQAHASLALALLGARRLHAAGIEANIALGFDGNDPFCHYTGAAIRAAERKLDDAWQHCLVALHADTVDIDVYVLAASIRSLRGEPQAARDLLAEALALDADHVASLTALARLDLHERRIDEAKRRIETALTADPSDVGAHVVAGYIALHTGDLGEAEQHARFALGSNAADHDALVLFTAIKARRNLVLGLWWRFNSFVSLRSERAQIGLLIGSFVLIRIAIILAGAFGFEDVEIVLGKVWLGFCAYTWFAPAIFRWMLARELHTVVLREDY